MKARRLWRGEDIFVFKTRNEYIYIYIPPTEDQINEILALLDMPLCESNNKSNGNAD